jgi:hypothetical protein
VTISGPGFRGEGPGPGSGSRRADAGERGIVAWAQNCGAQRRRGSSAKRRSWPPRLVRARRRSWGGGVESCAWHAGQRGVGRRRLISQRRQCIVVWARALRLRSLRRPRPSPATKSRKPRTRAQFAGAHLAGGRGPKVQGLRHSGPRAQGPGASGALKVRGPRAEKLEEPGDGVGLGHHRPRRRGTEGCAGVQQPLVWLLRARARGACGLSEGARAAPARGSCHRGKAGRSREEKPGRRASRGRRSSLAEGG